jgi:hypothetical protein
LSRGISLFDAEHDGGHTPSAELAEHACPGLDRVPKLARHEVGERVRERSRYGDVGDQCQGRPYGV